MTSQTNCASINVDVRPQLYPRATRADSPRRLSLHRGLRAGEHRVVSILVAARLAWDAGDALVRLFLPRPAAGHAARRRAGGGARGRPHQPSDERGAAFGTRTRTCGASARVDLHERVRLPREPQPGWRADRTHG